MRLILLRHAKSSRTDHDLRDHDRPLNERGRRDAPLVAQALMDLDWRPDFVLSSNAKRTQETWAGMAPVLGQAPAEFSPGLYLASAQTLAELISQQSADTLLVLGHNPGLECLVQELCGQAERMTTCNAALLSSTASSWSEALQSPWTLHQVVRPKQLPRP